MDIVLYRLTSIVVVYLNVKNKTHKSLNIQLIQKTDTTNNKFSARMPSTRKPINGYGTTTKKQRNGREHRSSRISLTRLPVMVLSRWLVRVSTLPNTRLILLSFIHGSIK